MHQIDKSTKQTLVGFLYIVGGFALLLHVLGLFKKGLTLFLAALALLIIILGFLKSGLWTYANEKFFTKK